MNHPLISALPFSYFHLYDNTIIKTSCSDVNLKADQLSNFLLAAKKKVLLSFLSNSVEWNITDQACLLSNITHIPLHENISKEELKRVVLETSPDIIIFKKERHRSMFKHLNLEKKMSLMNISQFEQLDYSNKQPPVKSHSNDTALILYTSGSTSLMKGIKHSCTNLVNAIDLFSPIVRDLKVTRALSYLPLSFSGERKLNYTYQKLGVDICYSARSKGLYENIQLFRPEIMALVPSGLEELSFELESHKESCSLKFIVCGGAKINSSILKRYEKLNIKILEVYGLTETASIATANTLKNCKPNSVGKPLPGVKIKIIDQGEICIYSTTLMQGYISKKPDWLTFDNKKYLRTGDIGYIDNEGFLFITGRLNNTIKLNNGMWLHPEELETSLVAFSNSAFDKAIVLMIKQKLTAIITTDLDETSVKAIIKDFNANHYVKIKNFIICNIDILQSRKNNSKVKFSRQDMIQEVLKSSPYEHEI